MKTLIRGGRVIDVSQRIDAKLNLLAEGGRIVCLTDEEPKADEILDATGRIVCPGFIDMHAHEDPVVDGVPYRDPEKANLACLLRMGVTTCLAGNCGDNFCDPVEFLDLVDRDGCFLSVMMLAGYTVFREKFSGADRYSSVTEAEQKRILREIANALDRGCAGISFGLEYVPGMSTSELEAASQLCSGSKKMIAAHIRYCAERAIEAADEVISAGVKAGIPVEISHIGSMAGYGEMSRFLRYIDARRAAGARVGCDCYPYTAFSTRLGSAPYDDLEAMHCTYGDIELCEGEYRGLRCTREIFEKERVLHPDTITVGHVMKPEDIRLAFQHPNVTVGSDCFLSSGTGHPRAAGAFPRFLCKSAPECGMSLVEAIGRITDLPARLLGLTQKGTLRPGADADIVIFDPENLTDRSTFENPTLPPDGISCVLIGGQVAVKEGRILNATLGRALRR